MKIFGYALAVLRFILLIISLIVVVSIGSILFYSKLAGPKTGFKIRTYWCKLALWIFGIKIIKTGELELHSGSLYVCNHRSFVDPVVAFSLISNGSAVSKAEVADYPLIGLGAKISGVIFVDRNNKTSRNNTKDSITNALKDNTSVLLFPEGTISIQRNPLEFRKGSFEAAAMANARVVPFAMEYMNPKKDFWYIDNILGQYFHSFSNLKMEVRVHFFPSLISPDPTLLMNTSESLIKNKMKEFQLHWEEKQLLPDM